jgi:large conductance mechanosensitive channel
MVKGFKEFIMRGNVVDLAVGVVIGAAFGALVTQLTASFIDPVIKLIGGGGDVGGTFTVDGVVFDYGAFITAIITFVLTAAAIYFIVVMPYNTLRERRSKGEEADAEPTNEEKMIALLEQIASKN